MSGSDFRRGIPQMKEGTSEVLNPLAIRTQRRQRASEMNPVTAYEEQEDGVPHIAMDVRLFAMLQAKLEDYERQIQEMKENSKSFEDICKELASHQRKTADLVEKLGHAAERHRLLNEELLARRGADEKRALELQRKIADLRIENRDLSGKVTALEEDLEAVRDELHDRNEEARKLRDEMSAQEKRFTKKLNTQEEDHSAQISELHVMVAKLMQQNDDNAADVDLRQIAAAMHKYVFREMTKLHLMSWTDHINTFAVGTKDEKDELSGWLLDAACHVGFSPAQWNALRDLKSDMNKDAHPKLKSIDKKRAAARAKTHGQDVSAALSISFARLNM